MAHRSPRKVAKRRVFYIPGYDPLPPRRYRELYRTEGAKQAEISGYTLSLETPQVGTGFGWRASADVQGQKSQADVEVLVWSDIVRGSMDLSILQTYAKLLRTAWIYITTGALWRLMKLRKGPVIAALYPVVMLLLQAVVAVGLGWAVYSGVLWAFSSVHPGSVAGHPGLHAAAGAGAGLYAALRLLRWFKAKDGRIFAYYLMHDFAYSAAARGANPPPLEERMAQFAEQIAEALTGPYDEVLVVGHSSGAHLAVSILADVIRSGRAPKGGPELAFLSLGQVVPMVSFLPNAHRLRADLHYVSTSDALTWVDVTAPGDGCSFALCDPVAVSGVAPPDQRWPLVFSAAFTKSLSSQTWRRLQWRFFRLHFQYLCAFDQPRDYDYFQITAGPQSLADRYSQRSPSRSRLVTPVNGYTSTAA